MFKKLCILAAVFFLMGSNAFALAAPKWDQVASHIAQEMQRSFEIYSSGDVDGAKKNIDDVYYGIYEKDGLEMTVRNTVASKNANLTEYQFSKIKKLMTNQAPPDQVKQEISILMQMIQSDVGKLQGVNSGHGGWASFWPAFLILVREGVEAILVIAAILAYLTKSGNAAKVSIVYNYSLAAILASFVTAFVFHIFTQSSGAGANQEIMEGATMLVAVIVLLSVSYWMGGKANTQAWSNYIETKVETSLSTKNTIALGLTAFLAVYREGAEVVLFYQALFNGAGDDVQMIWLGFAAGCLALAIIFLLIRYGTLKIPLQPFFVGTSVFMYVLAVSFAGSGVKELQEGGIIGSTQLEGFPSIDFLGLYPSMETLVPQIILIAAAVISIVYKKIKLKGV
ncbi:FTR1 family iron permease [Propionispira raffinosivorans]|uniref:FTR1 family iron permease n=1 Tax=Propionispira raffinosivorans TaxID=86959 RepID=UPI0003802FEA|nr:FTR1 family protein [Propionispira raffinosivorans]